MSYGKIDPKIDGQVRALRSTVALDLADMQKRYDVLVTGLGNTLIELVDLKRRVERLESRSTAETGEVSG